MEFKDLRESSGLNSLDEHLANRSFVSGHEASQNDVTVFRAVDKDSVKAFGNVHRWYLHMKTYTSFDLKNLPKSDEKVVVEQPTKEVQMNVVILVTFELHPP